MRLWRSLVLLGVILPPVAHAADARVTFLSKQLEKATDPRARAQAALLLGATQDPSAVPPLCKALQDKEDVVKAASAKSLDSIGDLSAIDCLKAAAGAGDAQSAIHAALSSLQSIKNQVPKLYLLLAPPDNKANLAADQLNFLMDRLKARLSRLGVLWAPPDEPKAQAVKILKSRKLKGFMLMTTVESVGSAGLSITLVGLTYPEKSIKGQISVKAQGAPPPDLIKALVPKAVDEAADEFEWKD